MKQIKLVLVCFFLIGIVTNSNAQLWKKLKKKVLDKVDQKIEKKVEEETDKVINKTLDGQKNEESNPERSFGNASINHSTKYGDVLVNQLTKTKVNKYGSQFQFIGNWVTSSIDVFDGYNLQILNAESIDALNEKKTFKIPEEATLTLGYEPFKEYKGESSGEGQNYDLESGTVTIIFNKDKNVSISFTGSATLSKAVLKTTGIDEYNYIKTPVSLDGVINTTLPEYTVTQKRNQNTKKSENNEPLESDKAYITEKLSPNINIPDSFSFDKNIEAEITDDKGKKYPMEFLLGKYPDIYGISVSSKEMGGQGQVVMIMTPKTSTAFMDVSGMKMKRSTSLEQMGSQFGVTNKMPDGNDFEYKKTGKTKTILGYTCYEYNVDYNYTDAKGNTSFWVSKDFPMQNVELPMLGMKMNNPYLDGFVLELNATQEGQSWSIKVIRVTDKKTAINTSEYKNMGF